jgi:hypothetical protein
MIGWLLLLLTKERRAYRKYSSLSLGNLVMKVLQLALQMSEGFWYGKTKPLFEGTMITPFSPFSPIQTE